MTSGEKTVSLLKLLGQAPYVHSVTELGEKIGCTKSGTCKLLAALVKSGLATQTVDRKYTLGPVVYILGKTYEDHIGLSKMVKPYLVRLRDLTGENASFSMLVDGKANLVYREESLQAVRVAGSVGQERPLYAGANGKVLGAFQSDEVIRRRLMEEPITPLTERTIISPDELLKEYAKIRAQGYAISDGELSIETIGISAPIRDESGTVWAAISIGAPRLRVDQTKLERYIFLVKEIAKEMSKDLSSGAIGNSL
ncbi:Acetate operon repressor [uncultured Clostridium sp.]|uniref:IclR family transcriptional regulator n=1 Tax=Flintibacter hominis TaxID=2763048 RepID=A0A8J6M7U7_9FIRM|nr:MULTISPECIES: IclR family transcriptional regulator [Eubacteriales]MBS5591392.1 IclR family transcriptional regulator [Clostridiales bacterium]SCH82663.1 Acetate operon repressor [uncultured Clostridium sp.]SCJ44297.1 Acetate operon repressor [uncultured Flavonifractor sp.]MBC5723623.1 IclR family transcriptional regulator [Flintibacter hominis]MCU6703362.1 IclR family transcriptional regulator [Muriventricola aceti]